jgi:hypothetical protein
VGQMEVIENGVEIYKKLRLKYPKTNQEDLDKVLNSLCAAVVILIMNNVDKENYGPFLQCVYHCINTTLRNTQDDDNK